MAHMKAINASMFSDLSFVKDDTLTVTRETGLEWLKADGTALPDKDTPTVADLIKTVEADNITKPSDVTKCCAEPFTKDNFTSNKWMRIANVREFPAMGTPPNIVNVPVYGQKTSQQIQGQADAPSLEIQINYVASDWDKTGNSAAADKKLGDIVGDNRTYLFRFAMMASDPVTYDNYTAGTDAIPATSTDPAVPAKPATGLGSVDNTEFYFFAKLEAMQVTPQLTDANTCTLTLSLQSDFYGPSTQNATTT